MTSERVESDFFYCGILRTYCGILRAYWHQYGACCRKSNGKSWWIEKECLSLQTRDNYSSLLTKQIQNDYEEEVYLRRLWIYLRR